MPRRKLDRQLVRTIRIVAGFLLLFWGIELADYLVFRHALDGYGIQPRVLIGLRGILFAPFLHGGFEHLAANSIPFAVLGGLVLMRKEGDFWRATVFAALIGGVGTWLLGKTGSVHIGASGLVFGYFGFLLAAAWLERSLRSVLVAALVVFLYGGIVYGLSPLQPLVSWQGHLFGMLGGIEAAYGLGGRNRRKSRQ